MDITGDGGAIEASSSRSANHMNHHHMPSSSAMELDASKATNKTSTTPTLDGTGAASDCTAGRPQSVRPTMTNSSGSNNSHMPKARVLKKSWSELKQSVSELRRNLASLGSMVPSNIHFRTLRDGRTRIYFLGTPPNGWETTLMYVDIQPAAAAKCRSGNNGCGAADGDGEVRNNACHFRQRNYDEYDNDDDDDTEEMPEEHRSGAKKLHWGLLLELALPNMNVYGILPPAREVQLLLERKRLSMLGISSYEIHPASGKIVFPLSTRLYQCHDYGYDKLLVPSEVRCTKLWAALDPQICPDNSDLIAHVSGGDIWVTHTITSQSERITFAHDGRRSFADDPLSAGTPAYVMQEEFSRYQGYWWRPSAEDGVYSFVYEEVDESNVNLFTFPSSQAEGGGEFEEYRFPRAGTPNAKSKLKLAQFRLSEAMRITDIRILDMQYQLTHSIAWLEYIVRVGWTPDGQYVWLQALNRRQQRLELVLVPFAYFCDQSSSYQPHEHLHYTAAQHPQLHQPQQQPANDASSSTTHPGDFDSSADVGSPPPTAAPLLTSISLPPPPLQALASSPLQVICSQRSKKWVNVHNVLEFLEVSATHCRFLWAAEDSGYRHLYLITSALTVPTAVGPQQRCGSTTSNKTTTPIITTTTTTSSASGGGGGPTDDTTFTPSAATLLPRIESRVALTTGDWEVLCDAVWLDRRRQLVYFLGLRETPLERHLYVVSLLRPGVVRLLTAPGSSYAVEFNAERTIMMQTFCSIRQQPSCCVVRLEHPSDADGGDDDGGDGVVPVADVDTIRLVAVGTLIEGASADAEDTHCPVIYAPRLASGDQAYAMVFRPHNYMPGLRYPVVLNVYGGPEVQTVNNTYKGMRQLRMHMLAAQGYCVVCIDARGSWHRGMAFESYLHRRMGQVELADQVEALRMLAGELGFLDMERVAIHGWSYGGYLSLMGLVQHPDVFRVAIAGAPVTDWEYYDTGYTERYMDLPSQNKEGYVAGSVLSHVTRFPDEDNRLLIIHGLIDENVHFFHTSQLVNQLVKHNKPYQLQVYPGERHSLRNLEASKHYETKLLSFLQNNL